MSVGQFAVKRLERLYPLYLLGAVFGIVCMVVVEPDELMGSSTWLAGISALLLLPTFDPLAWQTSKASAFPMNGPSWSLFFELLVGLYFFFILKNRSKAWAAIGFVALSVLYVWSTSVYSLHSGYTTGNFLGGFPRVMLFFSLGMLIYKMHRRIPVQRWTFAAATMLILVCFELKNIWIVYATLLLVAPLTVLLASRVPVDEQSRVGLILDALGKVSYPIYILHFPLAKLLQVLAPDLAPLPYVVIGVCGSIAVACLGIWLEPPLRAAFRSIAGVMVRKSWRAGTP